MTTNRVWFNHWDRHKTPCKSVKEFTVEGFEKFHFATVKMPRLKSRYCAIEYTTGCTIVTKFKTRAECESSAIERIKADGIHRFTRRVNRNRKFWGAVHTLPDLLEAGS